MTFRLLFSQRQWATPSATQSRETFYSMFPFALKKKAILRQLLWKRHTLRLPGQIVFYVTAFNETYSKRGGYWCWHAWCQWVRRFWFSVQNDPSAPRSVQLPCGQFPSSPAAGKQSPKKFKHSKNKKPAAATILLIIYLLNTNTKGLKKTINIKSFLQKNLELTSLPPVSRSLSCYGIFLEMS